MGSFGGFYKGDKKKQKKGKENKAVFSGSNAPVFVLPELIAKKKKPGES